MPPSHRAAALSVYGGRPSVRLSVCHVPDSKSRMGGYSKLKIGRNEAHDTGDPWPHLEVERSKVNVTRPINAETEMRHIFVTGRHTNFKLGTRRENDDPHDLKNQRSRSTGRSGCLFKSPRAGGEGILWRLQYSAVSRSSVSVYQVSLWLAAPKNF